MATFGYLVPTRGVVFSSESDAELTARARADVVGLAERAESMGFDGVWIGDSVLAKPRFEPLTALGAIAAATDAVTLGTAVYLPGLRHPVHVAHQTATLDRVAGGRLALGVGVGVRPIERAEAENLDVPFDRRGALLNESLGIVDRLWSGDAVTHDGEFFSLDGASIGFGPDGDVPVYVASAALDPERGFPPTVRERFRRFGDGWLPIAVEPDSYAAGLERARDAYADAGRDPDALDAKYYVDVVVAETEADAISSSRRDPVCHRRRRGRETALTSRTLFETSVFVSLIGGDSTGRGRRDGDENAHTTPNRSKLAYTCSRRSQTPMNAQIGRYASTILRESVSDEYTGYRLHITEIAIEQRRLPDDDYC